MKIHQSRHFGWKKWAHLPAEKSALGTCHDHIPILFLHDDRPLRLLLLGRRLFGRLVTGGGRGGQLLRLLGRLQLLLQALNIANGVKKLYFPKFRERFLRNYAKFTLLEMKQTTFNFLS